MIVDCWEFLLLLCLDINNIIVCSRATRFFYTRFFHTLNDMRCACPGGGGGDKYFGGGPNISAIFGPGGPNITGVQISRDSTKVI